MPSTAATRGGLAHTGFDRTVDDLAKAARLFGIAVFAQKNAYTCGALGWFTGRLAALGLVSIAATNGPAMLAGSGSIRPVYCTNPLSFAAPAAGGPPMLGGPRPPTPAMKRFALALARQKRVPLPPGYAASAAVCRAFLDQHAPKKAEPAAKPAARPVRKRRRGKESAEARGVP